MKVIKLYNKRDVWGGEDRVVESVTDLLKRNTVQVCLLTLTNSDLASGLTGKLKAFFGGIYSLPAKKEMARVIEREKPNIVHSHNLYPFFSPSVLVACREKGVPVVLHTHSYLLTCPTTFHFRENRICQLCLGGREYWCVLKNCRENIFESVGYSLRCAIARQMKLFENNATFIITVSKFAKNILIKAGYKKEQIVVLPNMVPIPPKAVDPGNGDYIAYSGRFSTEKGIGTLLKAAAKLLGVSIKLAGDGPLLSEVRRKANENVSCLGWMNGVELSHFYRKARFLVVPSACHEVFGLVAAEAMSYGLPVVASNHGGLAEIVNDGETGLLFEPNNTGDLETKMRLLWDDKQLCRRMGEAARKKAIQEYSEGIYYKRLMEIYANAISIGKGRSAVPERTELHRG